MVPKESQPPDEIVKRLSGPDPDVVDGDALLPQIVHILNEHMSALQWIESESVSLRSQLR